MSISDPSSGDHGSYRVVDDELQGVRLGAYLWQQWPELDRVALRNLILDGFVEVNAEEATRPDRRLRGGDVVQIAAEAPLASIRRHLPQADADGPARFTVLHEDEQILVVDKPWGVPIAGRPGKDAAVLAELAESRPGIQFRAVHRPDRDASGCLVLAKDLETSRRCAEALAAGELRADYLALVHGQIPWSERRVDREIGPDPRRPGRVAVVEPGSKGARSAVTDCAVVESFRRFGLVRARPLTSRNHQLRVHLGFLGHPVVADPDYGVRDHLLLSDIKKNYKARPGVVERPLLNRMFLHVERVCFPDREGQPVEVAAPLPADLELVLSKLRSFAPKS